MTPLKFLLDKIDKLRIWGVKGAFNYLARICTPDRNRRFLIENAKRNPMTPTRGITLLADMTQRSSLSKVMRDLAAKLKDVGIPFQVYNIGKRDDIFFSDLKDLVTPVDTFRILKYNHVVGMQAYPFVRSLPLQYARIMFWEFSSGLLEYDCSLCNAETVIAMSDFNAEVFRRILPAKISVQKMLYPFIFPPKTMPSPKAIRHQYSIEPDDFVVFFNFSYGSSFHRKNPNGAMLAFARAFGNTPNAKLLFKTNDSTAHEREHLLLKSLANELGIGQRFTTIDTYMPTADIYGLTAACDVYLSLHRGEGFGLGVAEAMSLGKPVVVTDYSSTTEFCKSDSAILVPYHIVDIPRKMRDNPCYAKVKTWAEPDIDAAATALRNLYDHPEKRHQLGESARRFITNYFSAENFRKSIEKFLAP